MRVALVTGGTRGIGAEISKLLKNKNYLVVANYHTDQDAADSFTKEFDIPVASFDVKDPELCLSNCRDIEKKFGPIDILVHSAGITRDSFLHKLSVDMWKDVIDTNLSSCFYMARSIIPSMRERKFGRLVFLSSINAVKGQMGQTNYTASKAGILGFVKSLALENANKGITVNAVAPGYTNTDMVRQIKPEIREQIIKGIPIGQILSPNDIARCIEFLVDDAASAITGETFHVNGGQWMG